MKAITYRRYGPPEVLQLEDLPRPEPRPHELLIRVRATTVSTGDWRLRKPDPFAVRFFFGFRRPRQPVLGVVFAGVVESVGGKVKRFKPGDEIFGSAGIRCGAYAEYLCLHEDGAVGTKPANMNFEEAASVPFGALTALDYLQRAHVTPGQKVLVYGASGAVGSAAVQLARHFGGEVTAVCSTSNLELVRSLGAVHTLDYTREDIAAHNIAYDVVFEAVGKLPMATCEKLLTPKGHLLLASAGPGEMLRGLWLSLTSKRRVSSGMTKETADNMLFLKNLIEKGEYKAVIDRRYAMEQMAEAHTYAEQGHKKGNVVVTIG